MFNNILHQNVRSQIISLLIKNNELSFKILKKTLNLSDGNLSAHISKLKKANYVNVKKSFLDNRPITTIKITDECKKEFKIYIKQLQEFVKNSQ